MSQEKYLSKFVAIRTAPGELVGVGQVIAYTHRPTVSVRMPDGTQKHWIADLCEVLPLKDDVVEALVLATQNAALLLRGE